MWPAALGFALAMLPAQAAEIVTLRSGFAVTCASREVLPDRQVRLHLSPNNDGNYMDVPAESIAGVEAAPDLPVQGMQAASSTPSGTFPRTHTSSITGMTKVRNPDTAANTPDTGALLATSGARHNVHVALLAAVVQAESGGNPRAVSRAGARGLMQLMPATATQLGVDDSFSPEGNVNGGSAYLDQLLTRYHENLPLALAAYNAGPAAVDRYHGMPPYRETQLYVARVIREFNRRVSRAEAQRTAATVLQRPAAPQETALNTQQETANSQQVVALNRQRVDALNRRQVDAQNRQRVTAQNR